MTVASASNQSGISGRSTTTANFRARPQAIVLGMVLGLFGLLRVTMWEQFFGAYGQHWFLRGLTVNAVARRRRALGTLAGSMLRSS